MSSENREGIVQRLRKLIGRDCEYLGTRCRLVEILTNEEVLILEAHEAVPPIQRDQYGRAAYRGNDLVQVPIFRRDGASFSEEIIDLFASLNDHRKGGESTAI